MTVEPVASLIQMQIVRVMDTGGHPHALPRPSLSRSNRANAIGLRSLPAA
jgi:hypothetical protein